ncbi:hypothetical protein ABTY20_19210 [Streptomyces sp. NPDC126497]|uniref:hypothetical protein n=1 Tax=Streptomyces sp. NPDC126497 TaxID=3155313 RepID=UPI00332C63FB
MNIYALKHPDGRWLYHLPVPDAFGRPGFTARAKLTGVFADGRPMTELHGNWWATDREAARLTATAQPRPKTTGYRLIDPAAESVRYPATLTREQFDDRVRGDEDTLWSFYTAVTEEQPPLEHVYDGPVMVLEGREPPAPDEPQWIAQLPYVLAERAEYAHLFPGHIPGLAAHMMDVFRAMPCVDFVSLNFQNRPGVHVSLYVPYDEPRTEWRANTGRDGRPLKSGRNVPVKVNRRLTLPIPDRVAADSYAEALELWEQQVAHWTGVVESVSVAACSHCDGKGYVSHGAEQYGR